MNGSTPCKTTDPLDVEMRAPLTAGGAAGCLRV